MGKGRLQNYEVLQQPLFTIYASNSRRLFSGLSHKSELFLRLNRGQLKYLQIEIEYVSKAICLANEPSNFVVESFGRCIAHSVEGPICDDS